MIRFLTVQAMLVTGYFHLFQDDDRWWMVVAFLVSYFLVSALIGYEAVKQDVVAEANEALEEILADHEDAAQHGEQPHDDGEPYVDGNGLNGAYRRRRARGSHGHD